MSGGGIWGDVCISFGLEGSSSLPPSWEASIHWFHPSVLTPNLYSTTFVGENNRIWGDSCVPFGVEGDVAPSWLSL